MPNPRAIAFNVLLKIEKDGAYSNLALNNAVKENSLSQLDASFLSALVYGVLERKLTLDYIIKQHSKIPLRKIEIRTKIILRLGILQLLFMDKIPESAAVNESVNLAKWQKLQKSSGFINGILRSITRAEQKYTLPDETDKIYYYSIKYSCPQELVKLWYDSYGENNAAELLKSLSGRTEIYARVNTLKTDSESLAAVLKSEGVSAEICSAAPNALKISNTGSVEKLTSFKEGLFHIQDLSSQLCAYFLDAKPHQTVLDICSAPGGKAFTAAQYMKNTGKLIACDMYEHKLKLIENGAKRLGITNTATILRDGADNKIVLPLADRILCDVPCSGLGVLSSKPEIRYKDNLISNDLCELQYRILCESAKYLSVGGLLLYSTCTLNPAENNENAEKFLLRHSDFEGVELKLPQGITRAFDEQPYEITLMPHTAKSNGFYISLFRKRVR